MTSWRTTAVLGLALLSTAPATAAGDETRVFVGPCVGDVDPGGPRLAGALETAVGTAIRSGLGRLGGALRAAGAARSRTAVARLNLQLEPGEQPACVQLARGTFDPCETTAAPWSPDGATGPAAMLAAGICLREEPSFFAELVLRRSGNGAAVSLAPSLLHYGLTLDGRGGTRDRALAIQLAFHPPGEPPDGHAATGAVVVFGDTAVGTSTTYDPLRPRETRPLESNWFPSPFPPPRPDGATGPPPDDDTTTGSAASTPATLTATVIETRDERPFLLFLADLLDASSGELEAELQSLVLRDRRRELELEAEGRRQLALVEFESARTSALVTRMEYCALPDDDTPGAARARLELSTALMRAQVLANLAADAADRPRPFDPPITPSAGPRRGCG